MNHFPSWHNMAVSQWEIVFNRLLKRLYELHSLSVPMFCFLVFKPYVSGCFWWRGSPRVLPNTSGTHLGHFFGRQLCSGSAPLSCRTTVTSAFGHLGMTVWVKSQGPGESQNEVVMDVHRAKCGIRIHYNSLYRFGPSSYDLWHVVTILVKPGGISHYSVFNLYTSMINLGMG